MRGVRGVQRRAHATPVDYLFDLIQVRQSHRGENRSRGDGGRNADEAESEGLLSTPDDAFLLADSQDGDGDIELQEVNSHSQGRDTSAERAGGIFNKREEGKGEKEVEGNGKISSQQHHAIEFVHDKFVESTEYMQLHDRRDILLRRQLNMNNRHFSSPRNSNETRDHEAKQQEETEPAWNRLPEIKLQYLKGSGVPPLTQVWVLFSRQLQVINYVTCYFSFFCFACLYTRISDVIFCCIFFIGEGQSASQQCVARCADHSRHCAVVRFLQPTDAVGVREASAGCDVAESFVTLCAGPAECAAPFPAPRGGPHGAVE